MENEENTTAGAMNAINEALGLEGDEAHTPPEDDNAETADGADDGDTSTGESDADGDAGDGDSESDAEGKVPAQETSAEKAAAVARGERNPDGTFKRKEEAKKPDPLNDPIPKDLKKETSERIQSLIRTTKEVTAERDQVRADFETIVNGIKASGSTPEQYGEVISWMSLFNSPDPQARMKAYELVNDVADRLAVMLNIDRTAADPLAKHPDLQQAVRGGQIALPYAKEIARTRDAKAFQGQIETGVRQQQQTVQQQQQELSTARNALNQFETEMRAADPLYQRKRDAIVPAMQVAFKSIPPSKWAETFKAAYQTVKLAPIGKPNGAKPNGQQQPLRGNKNPAGGQARGATSMLDAINGALSGMKN